MTLDYDHNSTFRINKQNNENYLMRLEGAGISIVADIPESFNVSTTSEWESRSNIQGTGATSFSDAGAKAFDTAFTVQRFTEQVWVASSPIEMAFTLLFDATSDARVDVHVPMGKLQMASSPTPAMGLLFSPSKTPFRLSIGKQMVVKDCILVSVNNTFDNRRDKNGFPISGSSEITLRTKYIPSKREVGEMYGIANGGRYGSPSLEGQNYAKNRG